jgi:tRNA (cmo5U34)-methyltransferase
MNKWIETEHLARYLKRADRIPHREEGERVLLEHLPGRVRRVLDIGTGEGRLLAKILSGQPDAEGIGLDFSPAIAGTRSITICWQQEGPHRRSQL